MQTPDQYFDSMGWANHFDFEVVEAAREHFHNLLRRGTISKAEAIERAWSYAQGASRFMQKPAA